MRLCKLLRMMDRYCYGLFLNNCLKICPLFSGPGRAKLSRSSRSSTLLPAFVLFEATSSGVPSSAFSPPTSDSKKKLRQSWPVKGAHGSPLVAAELFASVRDEVNISQTEETGKFTTKLSIAPAVATISTDKIVSPATEPRVSSPTKSRSTSSRATVKGIQTSSARSIVEKPSVSAVVSPIVQNVTTSAPERSQTIITSRSEARKTHLNPLTAKSVMAHSSKTAVLREHPSYATQSYPVKKK